MIVRGSGARARRLAWLGLGLTVAGVTTPAAAAGVTFSKLATPRHLGPTPPASLPTAVVGGRVLAFSGNAVGSWAVGAHKLSGVRSATAPDNPRTDGATLFGESDQGAQQLKAITSSGFGPMAAVTHAPGVHTFTGSPIGAGRIGGDTILFLGFGYSLRAIRIRAGVAVQSWRIRINLTNTRGAGAVSEGQDAAGTIWLAWKADRQPVKIARIDPTTLRVAGGIIKAPKASATITVGWRLACAKVCRIVYLAGVDEVGEKARIESWAPGAPAEVVGSAEVGLSVITGILASYDGTGHLWLAYQSTSKAKTLVVRRGNAIGAGGSATSLGSPTRRVLQGLQGVGKRAVVFSTLDLFHVTLADVVVSG